MIQHSIIRYILLPLGRIMGRLSEKTKDRLFVLAGLGIFIYIFLYTASVIRWRYLYSFVLCCVFMGVMILCSITEEMKPIKFRLSVTVPWVLVGMFVLISGITQNVEYLPESMLFLVAYPILFLCWNNMEQEKVFTRLIRICRWSMLVFFLASWLLFEISTKRYGGSFKNVNTCALYLSLVSVCLLNAILYRHKFNWRCVLDILLFGITQAMVYYTNSRSGQLAVIVSIAIGIVIYLMTHRIRDNLQCMLRGTGCILISIVMIYSLLYIFQLRQYLPLPYYEKSDRVFYFPDMWEEKLFAPEESQLIISGSENEVPSATEETIKEEDIESEETLNKVTAKPGLSSYQEVRENKKDTSGKTLDEISTGRVTIWSHYVKDLNLMGHKEIPKLYIKDGKYEIRSTHMTILSVAYKSGIPAGIAYLCLNVSSGILGIWLAFRNRKNCYAVLPIMVILAFGACSLAESMDGSFSYMLTFYYYLTLFPMFQKGSLEEKKQLTAETED